MAKYYACPNCGANTDLEIHDDHCGCCGISPEHGKVIGKLKEKLLQFKSVGTTLKNFCIGFFAEDTDDIPGWEEFTKLLEE